MINKRATSIVFLFICLTISIIVIADKIEEQQDPYKNLLDVEVVDESIFKEMTYYALENDKESLFFNAKSLIILNKKKFIFQSAYGTSYDELGKSTHFKANKGDYNVSTKDMNMLGDVEFRSIDGTYKADKISYYFSKSNIKAFGNVDVLYQDLETEDVLDIQSVEMDADLDKEVSFFKGNVRGQLKRKRSYEGGFSFSSQKLKVDKVENQLTLSKDVNLLRNNMDISAQNAEIFLENFNKRLKYYVFYDDIKLVETIKLESGEERERKAYAEKVEGFITEAKVVLSGAPRVEQESDIIKGYQITLRENVELVEVDDSQSSFKLRRD